MKISHVAIFFSLIIAMPAFADKPEWTGKGKPTTEQKDMHRSAMQAKDEMKDNDLNKKDHEMKEMKMKSEEKREREHNDMKGLDKQQERKSKQMQNELDKGSDKGMEQRQQSKKWWKFWGE